MSADDAAAAAEEPAARSGGAAGTLRSLLRTLGGFLLIAGGLVAAAVALVLLAGDVPLGAAGVGLVAAGGLVGGGKLVFGDGKEAGADGDGRDGAAAAAEEGEGSASPASWLGALTGAALSGAIQLWALVWMTAFTGGAVYVGWKTVEFARQGSTTGAAVYGALTLLLGGVVAHRLSLVWRKRREERRDYRKEPGAYRGEWATPRFRTSGFPLTAGVWRMTTSVDSWRWIFLGVLFNWGLVGTIAVLASPVVLLPGFLFVAAGLWFAVVLYQGARHRLRYDPALFTLEELPPRLGGTLSATLETGLDPREVPEDGFHVVVSCDRRKPGLPRESTRYENVWYSEARVEPEAADPTTLSFDFELPEDAPPSTLGRLPARVVWRLQARADDLEPAWEQHVEVPVFPPDEDAGEES